MVKIYTDGSCRGNPGPGGWAVVIIDSNQQIELSGREEETTNNRMEMRALIEALKWTKKYEADRKIHLFSDSNLLISSLRLGWKRKQNLDLWQEIDRFRKGLSIEFHWVKGHATDPYNRRCDALAQNEAKKIDIKHKSGSVATAKERCLSCGRLISARLSLLPDSAQIRADCPLCYSFLRFAEKNQANLQKARKRVLLSNTEQAHFSKKALEDGIAISKNAFKRMTLKEAEAIFSNKQRLF